MTKLYAILLVPILLAGLSVTNSYSDDTILTLRLVHPDHDRISFLQPSEVKIDKKDYEYFELEKKNYWVSKKIELDITDMKDAKLQVITPPSKKEIEALSKTHPNTSFSLEPSYNVTIILNKKGQEKFMKLTANNIMRRLAIIFEGRLLIAPIITKKISGDEVVISSLSSYDDATRLRDTIKNYSARSQKKY